MCDGGNNVMDDWFGMDPPQPPPPMQLPPPPRQILRAQTLTGGQAKDTQKRVQIKALRDRKKRGDKSSGKSMLSIARSKGAGQPFMGGVSMTSGPSPMTGINYG